MKIDFNWVKTATWCTILSALLGWIVEPEMLTAWVTMITIGVFNFADAYYVHQNSNKDYRE